MLDFYFIKIFLKFYNPFDSVIVLSSCNILLFPNIGSIAKVYLDKSVGILSKNDREYGNIC
jgi:hypothetical protein